MRKDLNNIERKTGFITKIDTYHIWVSISKKSACTSCHAKEFCISTDCKNFEVCLERNGEDYYLGEEIEILAPNKVGFVAIFLAFVIPLLLLLFSIIVFQVFISSSLYLGLFTVSILSVYYLFIYLMRAKLKLVLKMYPQKITNDLQ